MSLNTFLAAHEDPLDVRHPMNIIDLNLDNFPNSNFRVQLPSTIRKFSLGHRLEAKLLEMKLPEVVRTLGLTSSTSKFLLMSEAEAFTTWHEDLTGTGVIYILIKGQKSVYLLPPTDYNRRCLALYHSNPLVPFSSICSSTPNLIVMQAGDVIYMPPRWIHSVATGDDSISFGVNFLPTFDLLPSISAFLEERLTGVSRAECFNNFESVLLLYLWDLSIVLQAGTSISGATWQVVKASFSMLSTLDGDDREDLRQSVIYLEANVRYL